MGAMTSPNDPVFFMHHCNLDRLWAHWQRMHPGSSPYLPVSGAATGHNLNDAMIFSAGPPAPWPGTWTPASVVEHHALGYRYDDEFILPRVDLPLSYVRILFGVINDAPGWVLGPDGKPHPVGPGDPWRQMSTVDRKQLVGLAMHQLAALVANKADRSQVQNVAGKLLGKSGQQLIAAKKKQRAR
jgi:hypothetical protein